MMTIMQKKTTAKTPQLRATQSRKEASHERIVEVAARAIRRSGYDGTGVADIMKEAGLTHGGFYAHFASREALLAEAADRARAEALGWTAQVVDAAPGAQGLERLTQAYLSDEHLNGAERGCAISALGSEMHRQAPEVRHVATRHIQELIDLVARQIPEGGERSAHDEAMVRISAMVGTLVLARAVDDPALSKSLREAALKYFAPADG
ncbi:AcrR family transcriptional regulator [Duganella sp. 1411]|uniref:TetR/AcrR family transcriptional regulator n=1 Tax=Duganella sp. 1411 TaxID=2806572 RepID=UPI001AE6C715|nr:TetR/AcrR family transcriptional regulator [Duganella sp. 1411]MBP1203528.1 AcrR family transcriptional regulator [Duganella sp. 1411]